MYDVVRTVKFNGEYFEHGDVVTTDRGKVIVGSIMIKNSDVSPTNNSILALDISEKYHSKRISIDNNNIENIQKIE